MKFKLNRVSTAALATALLGSSVAQAALISNPFIGTWDGMHSWNPGQNGGKVVDITAGGGPGMAVSGNVTYDDVTGAISAINIVGTTWVGKWADGFNNVQMQNWAWQSNGTNLNLLPGTARLACDRLNDGVFVTGASAACGPGYQNGQGTLALLADFTGVASDITAGSGSGTFFDAPIPGFTGTIVGGVGSVYALKVYNPFIPLGLDSTFNIQVVPVPGAVWLFGSALGLLGWARRRSATA
jgi:hypothetical protein